MMEFLLTGILLGASAGMAPGPLLALVISETLTSGFKSGVAAALAPLITDAPIVILSLALSAGISGFMPLLGGVSLAGAVFVFYLGLSHLCMPASSMDLTAMDLSSARAETSRIIFFQTKAFQKGLLANALSPHPWLFWFTVGGPLMLRALDTDMLAGARFMAGFYGLLVGSKILIAALVARSRSFLTGRIHGIIMRVLGVFLCGLGALLFRASLRYFDF